MSGFAAGWLQRRETFDAAARDCSFARSFAATAARFTTVRPVRIVDLAAGSGANFRALAPVIGADQDWLLVDHDPLLIAAQAAAIARWSQSNGWCCAITKADIVVETGAACWRVQTRSLDLAHAVEHIDFAAFDGITTSAFLDLVSAAWLDRLCDALTRARRPLLAVLTVDGRRAWRPVLPLDERVHDAFCRHQSGDKGFGTSLGGEAAGYMAERLAAQPFAVSTARSDWRIGAEHREMLLQMVAETYAVACAAEPAAAALFAGWAAERNAQIDAGVLALQVGHVDLLAVPNS